MRRIWLGKIGKEIDTVETARVDAIVRGGATDESLGQEEKRDDGKVFDRGALARRRNASEHLGMHMPALPAPSEEVEPAEREQHRRGRTEQRDQAERTP